MAIKFSTAKIKENGNNKRFCVKYNNKIYFVGQKGEPELVEMDLSDFTFTEDDDHNVELTEYIGTNQYVVMPNI